MTLLCAPSRSHISHLCSSLNTNEIRSLILRLHRNTTVSLSVSHGSSLIAILMHHCPLQFINKTISAIQHNCSAANANESSFSISISELASCFTSANWQQLNTESRYRFTTHEDSDLEFIMINTDRDRVLGLLDRLRKTPRYRWKCTVQCRHSSVQEILLPQRQSGEQRGAREHSDRNQNRRERIPRLHVSFRQPV